MLHAIKPMIWQALQTLKEPTEDAVRRGPLQVLSHNLSAEGVLGELIKSFGAHFPMEVDKVDIKRYLDTVIHDGVTTLTQKSEKEQKICVERAHKVCWELCRAQLRGSFPALLTEESTKIWWKIFNTFAERDSENQRTLYPIAMDWEEVDYWANVVLKVMALPTNTQRRQEREILRNTTLTFQDALIRFNGKLNENNGMYVVDQQGKPDVSYIESAMQELNVRLFEGIHLSGSLVSIRVRKGHAHIKWCVLYQLGLAFADNPADVDSANTKAFIPISTSTEVTPEKDKSGRPVRFQLTNGPDSWLFEANNVTVRNKWLTAILCLKHGKLPEYEKDFINRRKTRLQNREYDAEAKETMRKQKEKTKKQMEKMTKAMEEERQHHESEAEQLRNASAEELRARIKEHDSRMNSLMNQMTELGYQYEHEKTMMAEQHEQELQRLMRQLSDQMGSVQSELESELARLQRQIQQEREKHELDAQQKSARIGQLEDEVTRLNRQLASMTKQIEDSTSQHLSKSENFAAQIAAQQQANAQLKAEAEKLIRDVGEMRQNIAELENRQAQLTSENAELKGRAQQLESSANQHRSQSESSSVHLAAQQEANAQLKDEAEQLRQRLRDLEDCQVQWKEDKAKLEVAQRELRAAVSAKDSLEKYYLAQLSKATGGATSAVGHRGPGFDSSVGGQRRE